MYKTVYPTFAKFAKLAFRESGESSVNGLANVGESGEYSVNGLANVGESGESSVKGLANVGECMESGQNGGNGHFGEYSNSPNWQIFGEYSNSTNLPASGHCLD